MGKYCQNCGKKLNNNAKFCDRCGTQCDNNTGPEAWENVQDYTQMGYELKPGMSPEDMAANWTEASWGKNEGMDNLTSKYFKGIGRTILPRYYTNCFKTLLNEIQSDEKGLLYFAGIHMHAKNPLLQAGDYTYILTDKRVIMAGAFSNLV